MRESLRARLLAWHAATLALVMVVFASAITYQTWWSRVRAVDARLTARADRLSHAVVETGEGRVDVTLGPGLRYDDAPDVYHAIWAPDGSLVDRSDAAVAVSRPSVAGAWTRAGRREVARVAPSGVVVLAGTGLDRTRAEVQALVVELGALGGGILLLSVLAGWWVVGRALSPLDRINRTARRMGEGDLAARIPVEDVDTEVGQLARAVNDAFDRLQGAIDRQRRFTADASHELRTPLTSLSTEVQWALGRPRSAEDLRASLGVAARAVSRMQSVIERLLALARGEAVPPRSAAVALDQVVHAAAADLRPLAEAAGLVIECDVEPVQIDGDESQLRDAISNVLSNAIRYNVDGGRVGLRLRSANGVRELVVTDSGIGIPASDLPRVFEPFFRGDPARSRDTGGAGLGLALARAIVERHGGTIDCESTAATGTTVTMRWAQCRGA